MRQTYIRSTDTQHRPKLSYTNFLSLSGITKRLCWKKSQLCLHKIYLHKQNNEFDVESTELNFRVAETLFQHFGIELGAYMYPVDSANLYLSAIISKCLHVFSC